jgi:hypothetical protein
MKPKHDIRGNLIRRSVLGTVESFEKMGGVNSSGLLLGVGACNGVILKGKSGEKIPLPPACRSVLQSTEATTTM